MKLWKVLAMIALLNLAVVDFGIWRTDRYLVRFRDAGCDAEDHISRGIVKTKPCGPYEACISGTLERSTYDTMLFSFIEARRDYPYHAASLHFYGCDVNGKRYRMWLEK